MTESTPCTRCSRVHIRCAGHNRRGGPCGQNPLPDQRVCHLHGGRSPQALEAAERRRQARLALLEAETLGLPREVDPHTALLEELHRCAGAVQWLGAVVADLEQDRLVAGGPATAYVKLWQEERGQLARVAKTCVDVGIEERRVRLAESAGAQLASVIRAVLERISLSPEQQSLALTVVPEELRRVAELPAGEGVA